MKKYIAYYRVSTKKQELGLLAQRSTVEKYLSNGDNCIIIAEFQEKESGKDNDRTELNKALQLCKKENATLIIAKLDRLSRNVSFIFALKDANIDFLACDLPQFNTLTLAVFAALAQQERELISSRTRAALAEKRKIKKLGMPNNLLNNLDRAICNSVNRRREKALNNENNIKAYRLISALREQNKSWNYIANELNSNGFKTSQGSLFYAKTVCNVFNLYQ